MYRACSRHGLAAPEGGPGAEEPPPIQHDDLLGEAVSEEEAALVQQCITMAMRGRSQADMHMGAHQHFPGSQPVSLDRSNLALLKERRYWVRGFGCRQRGCARQLAPCGVWSPAGVSC